MLLFLVYFAALVDGFWQQCRSAQLHGYLRVALSLGGLIVAVFCACTALSRTLQLWRLSTRKWAQSSLGIMRLFVAALVNCKLPFEAEFFRPVYTLL